MVNSLLYGYPCIKASEAPSINMGVIVEPVQVKGEDLKQLADCKRI